MELDIDTIYEIIGFIGSALIVASLMMSAIVKLRIINMIGAGTFSLYGILIGSIPVAAMNGFIVLINIFYLSRMLGAKEYFTLLRVKSDNRYLDYFLDFYKKEIDKYQPGFTFQPGESDLCVFVLRDMVPAGLLIGNLDKNGVFSVKLDFVIPNYRDFKIGKYLFRDRREFLQKEGVEKVLTKSETKAHTKYLDKLGFESVDSDGHWYELALT